MVEYIVNGQIMPSTSLLTIKLKIRGEKCCLQRQKCPENNIFRDFKDLFLKYAEKLLKLLIKL